MTDTTSSLRKDIDKLITQVNLLISREREHERVIRALKDKIRSLEHTLSSIKHK